MFHSCFYCCKKSRVMIRCDQCNTRCHLTCVLNNKIKKCENCHMVRDGFDIISAYMKNKQNINYRDLVEYIQDL